MRAFSISRFGAFSLGTGGEALESRSVDAGAVGVIGGIARALEQAPVLGGEAVEVAPAPALAPAALVALRAATSDFASR